jgi:hypothetical protein
VQQVLEALVEWLRMPEQSSLRRAFTTWLKRVLLPGRLPGVNFEAMNELQEVKSMLAERVVEWTEEWKKQGMQEGRQEGRQEGEAIGVAKGEATLLQRLLEKRFGSLDEAVLHRLAEADPETLLRWGDRIFQASSAEEVVKD